MPVAAVKLEDFFRGFTYSIHVIPANLLFPTIDLSPDIDTTLQGHPLQPLETFG